MDKLTDDFTRNLKRIRPDTADKFIEEHEGEFYLAEKPYAAFMKKILKAKRLSQQEVFLRADISERYGYKILSEDKHTKQRDVIIRLCLASRMSVDEIQQALTLYELSPLFVKLKRDVLIAACVNGKRFDIQEVNRFLTDHGEKPLQGNYSEKS